MYLQIDSKLISLVNSADIFEQEMEYNLKISKLFKKNQFLYKLVCGAGTKYVEMFLLLIALVINILLLVDYKNSAGHYSYKGEYKKVIIILAIIESVLAGVFCLRWLILKYKLMINLQ